MSVIDEIAAERRRQVEVEGYALGLDDELCGGSLARAAAVYALNAGRTSDHATRHLDWWPWAMGSWNPKDRRRDLIRAAALIVAEIERLDRASPLSLRGSGADPRRGRIAEEVER